MDSHCQVHDSGNGMSWGFEMFLRLRFVDPSAVVGIFCVVRIAIWVLLVVFLRFVQVFIT